MLWLRGIVFTMLIPGSVAGYIPYILTHNRISDLDWGKQYEGWEALKKLQYIDRIAKEVGQVQPRLDRKSTRLNSSH